MKKQKGMVNKMELNYKLLEDIINIDSPTGYSSNVINYLEKVISKLGFKSYNR